MSNKFFAVAASLMLATSFVSAQPIPTRGVVEGFYGKPWSHQQRLDFFQFASQHHLNAYIYAPKDDPFHRSQWRTPYPNAHLLLLRELIQAASHNNVDFIFAISPGLDLDYSDSDLQAVISKFDAIHQLGCNHFAVFFDDIDDHDGNAQAHFLNRINQFFIASNPDIKPLITVPTEYFRLDMINSDGNINPYTHAFSNALDKNITVLYTGEGVVNTSLSNHQLQAANQIYNRPLALWWNYPVNDYIIQKLALGPVINLPSELHAVFFNPMHAFELSKISLATAADFALDPSNYNPHASWSNAIHHLFPTLATEMLTFADHSQHLHNDWADTGRHDATRLRAEFDRLLNGEDRNDVVKKILIDSIDAIKKLKSDLPPNVYIDCHDQLDQLERILEADQIAIDALFYKRSNAPTDQLKLILEGKLWSIQQHSNQAIISEDSALLFVYQVLNIISEP